MKRVLSCLSALVVVGFIISFAMLQSGCESADGVSGLTIAPGNVTITTNGQVVVFTVTGGVTNEDLALPLEWRVADASLGRIISSGGYSASYQCLTTRDGAVNTITAVDQYKNEGYATVKYDAGGNKYSINLKAEPSTTIKVGEAVTISITSEGSVAPYNWQKRTGPGTLTASSGSKSAVFTSDTAGAAAIEVTDGNGVAATIGIVVQEKSGDEGGEGGS